MSKTVSIAIKFDANTGKIVAVNGELKKLEHTIEDVNSKGSKLNSIFSGFGAKVAGLVGVASAIYGVGKALGFVVRSGFEANKELDASRAKLRAMISAGRDYITVSGKKVNALQREKLITAELNATMALLKKANAETAMGMSELIDVYALAKPGMDRHNWALKDQIEILKLVTNTASNFGVSAEELATGIDDLADGTWDATSGFGKMMKALGVTKEEFAAAANKVEYLKEKLKETGAAQDTWAVATSNLSVAWDNLTGKVTAPIFDIAKEGVKEFTIYLNSIDDSSIIDLQDALILTAKAGVKGAAYIATAWDGVKLVFKVAEVAIAKFGLLANEGMQGFSNITALAINKSYGFWVSFKNRVKQIWHDIVSYAANVWNSLLTSIGNSKFGKFIANKLHMDISGFKINVAPVELEQVRDIVKPADFSIGLDYWKKSLINAKSEEIELYSAILRKDKLTAADDFIKKIDKIAAKYKEAKKNIDNLHKAERLANKQLNKSAAGSKKVAKNHKSAADAAKKHNKELEKMAKAEERAAKEAEKLKHQYADIFKQGFNTILSGDFGGGLESIFKGLGNKLVSPLIEEVSNSLSVGLSGLTAGMGSFSSGFLGLGLSLVPSLLQGLFSSTVSEAEKKAAAGRVDFTDNSIKNLGNMFKDIINPHLQLTKDIRNATRNMDANFYKIAKSIAGTSASVDLTGQSYVPKAESGFLGFSSETRQLLGTGIKLGGTLKNSSASGYISELVQESSFWGLFTDTYTRERSISIPSKTQQAIREAFATGIKSILASATKLGFNENYIKKQIENYKIKIGKINLKGLSEKEAADRLNSAFAEIFSNAIGGIDTLVKLTDEYAKQGEQRLETLSRIAVEYEQLSYALNNINVQFNAQKNYLDVAQAFGSLTQFKDAYDAYVNNFYSVSERNKMLKRQLEKDFNNLGLTLPKTKDELKHLIETFKVTDKKTAETWKELLKLSDTFAKVQDTAKEAREKEIQAAKEAREKEIQAAKEAREGVLAYLKKINDLYLGEFSPLKIAQKEIYAMQIANNSNFRNFEENAKLALETKYKYATSELDYRSAFNSYLQALKTNAPKATLDDIVKKLEKQEQIQKEQNKKFDEQLQIALNNNKELQEVVNKLQQQIDLQRA